MKNMLMRGLKKQIALYFIHLKYTFEISLLNETRNEIEVHYGRNKDCLQNGKFYSRI